MRLPVLLYHHVGRRDLQTRRNLTVSPERFASHVGWLVARGYRGIRPADWLAWRVHGTALPRKPILITFDDAYAELVAHALPTLERNGFGAAVYVPTACVGRTLPWDDSPVMSAAEIREWAGRGIEFGAHTRTHPDL